MSICNLCKWSLNPAHLCYYENYICSITDIEHSLFIITTNSIINIYIYSHPQTDCFVLSELFSVARHAGRSKPESKPVQLYDRVRVRVNPHGYKRTTLAKGIFRYFIFRKQCHPRIDCFVVSQLFSVARHVGCLKRNPPNFTLDLVSYRSANKHTMSAREL